MDQLIKAPAMPAILKLSSVPWVAHGDRTLLSQVVLTDSRQVCFPTSRQM